MQIVLVILRNFEIFAGGLSQLPKAAFQNWAKLQKYNLYLNEKLERNFYKLKIISQFVIKLSHNFEKNEIKKQWISKNFNVPHKDEN